MSWKKIYARFRQPAIDAVTVAVATFVATLPGGSIKWSDALLLALAAGGSIFIKAVNPADTSYGFNAAWRVRPQPTDVNK